MNRNQTANNQSHPGSCCFHLTKNNDTHQEIFHPIENQSKTIKLHFNAIKSIQFHHRIFHGLESSKNICPKCPRSRSRLVSTSPKKATSGLRFLPWHNRSFWFLMLGDVLTLGYLKQKNGWFLCRFGFFRKRNIDFVQCFESWGKLHCTHRKTRKNTIDTVPSLHPMLAPMPLGMRLRSWVWFFLPRSVGADISRSTGE